MGTGASWKTHVLRQADTAQMFTLGETGNLDAACNSLLFNIWQLQAALTSHDSKFHCPVQLNNISSPIIQLKFQSLWFITSESMHKSTMRSPVHKSLCLITDAHSDQWPTLSLLPSLPAIGHCALSLGHIQSAKHVVVLLPCLPLINPSDILPKWIIRRGNWPTNMKVWQRNKEW